MNIHDAFSKELLVSTGRAVAILPLIVFLGFFIVGCGSLSRSKAAEDPVFVLQGVTDIEMVAQLIGAPPDSVNNTVQYDVYGADLGSMFNDGDTIYMVFGDTFGKGCPAPNGGPAGRNWRSNTMAVITDKDPRDGLTFDRMITDPAKGIAKELLSSKKKEGNEITVIPTHGIAAGGKMYLFFMSIKTWDPWTANYSGLAVSEDGGQNWKKLDDVRWPGDSGFIQVAPQRSLEPNEKGNYDIYIWGTPADRYGDIWLMKVDETEIENLSSYRYFAGFIDGNPIWSDKLEDAKPVAEGPAGEISVIYNEYLGRWIMTHFGGRGPFTHSLYIKEGLNPWGPWGKSFYILGQKEYPSLYAGYMHSFYVENNGEYIYFVMSIYTEYKAYLMKARLIKKVQ